MPKCLYVAIVRKPILGRTKFYFVSCRAFCKFRKKYKKVIVETGVYKLAEYSSYNANNMPTTTVVAYNPLENCGCDCDGGGTTPGVISGCCGAGVATPETLTGTISNSTCADVPNGTTFTFTYDSGEPIPTWDSNVLSLPSGFGNFSIGFRLTCNAGTFGWCITGNPPGVGCPGAGVNICQSTGGITIVSCDPFEIYGSINAGGCGGCGGLTAFRLTITE